MVRPSSQIPLESRYGHWNRVLGPGDVPSLSCGQPREEAAGPRLIGSISVSESLEQL